MSERIVLFARGINVGKNNRVSMAELSGGLSELGFTDITTVLASGNVIASWSEGTPTSAASELQNLLRDKFAIDVPCVARTGDQVDKILTSNPLEQVVDDPSRYLVYFFDAAPEPVLVKELEMDSFEPEVLSVLGTEAFVWTPQGIKTMTLSYAFLERRLKVVATARNWRTLQRIQAKL